MTYRQFETQLNSYPTLIDWGLETGDAYEMIVTIKAVKPGFDKALFAAWLRDYVPPTVTLTVRWDRTERPDIVEPDPRSPTDAELREQLRKLRGG